MISAGKDNFCGSNWVKLSQINFGTIAKRKKNLTNMANSNTLLCHDRVTILVHFGAPHGQPRYPSNPSNGWFRLLTP